MFLGKKISTRSKTLTIVTAAADCNGYLVLGTELDGRDDIGNVRKLDDHPWLLINHAIVGGTGVVVAVIAWTDDVAADGGNERVDLFLCQLVHGAKIWVGI